MKPRGALHIDYEDVETRRCRRGGRSYWLRQWTVGAARLMQPHLSLAADVMGSNMVRCGAVMASRDGVVWEVEVCALPRFIK